MAEAIHTKGGISLPFKRLFCTVMLEVADE